MPITVGSFNTLDDDLIADGAWADAFTLKSIITNTNYLLAKGMRRLVNKAWKIDDPYDVHPLGWTRILPIFYAQTSPLAQFARIRIRAKIPNTKIIYLIVSTRERKSELRGFPATDRLALVGDGTIKTYPTSGEYLVPVIPHELEEIRIFMASDERTVVADEKGNVYGLIAEVTDHDVRCWTQTPPPGGAYADFSNLDPIENDYYLCASTDTAGVNIISPSRRILFFTASGGIGLIYGWSGNELPTPWVNYWRLNQGIALELYSISIYEKERTTL